MKFSSVSEESAATQPSASTGGADPSAARFVMRWVFPSPAISELTDKHSFGRDQACDTVLPGTEVSRKHAEIKQGALPLLRDLGSRNGVFVDGQRVTERLLAPGAVVRIGEWVGITSEVRGPTVEPAQLSEITPGWYGGPLLAAKMDTLRRVASSGLPIVIQGATGTGKEGAARALHAWSGRSGPFMAVDCGAMPEQLAETLLFGHRKGAFTGADRASMGVLRAADGGTIFLDEILNLGLAMQAKLLRALERREVVPVGDTEAIPIDVHVTCAAQQPLAEAVAARQFRADLMSRLEGATLVLPTLHERAEEIVPLFFKLLEQHGAVEAVCEPKFIESLLLYDWPLNVRELVLLTRRLVAVHRAEPFKRSMLPERMVTALTKNASATSAQKTATARKPTDDEEAFTALLVGLRAHDGNLTKAAKSLGLTRARAYRLLEARPEFDLASARKRSES